MHQQDISHEARVDFVIYTVVDPSSSSSLKLYEYLSDTPVLSRQYSEIQHFTKDGRPAIIAISRLSSHGNPVEYRIDVYYRIMLGPGDGGDTAHISQVDNELFMDHLSLILKSNLLI